MEKAELQALQAPIKERYGTLAVSKEAPVGFRTIRVTFDLDTDASDEELATLLRLTERYCVVLQTIAGSPVLELVRARR